ncbi:MAG: ribosome silencing factor [Bacteroidales bacterium]|nr:ribosome silencing factor [Bacteroidales bacterium]
MPTKKKTEPKKVEKPVFDNIKDVVIQALMEKMGNDIVDIDLKKVNHVFFDDFIVCTATSGVHAETLCDYVQELAWKELKVRPSFVEGLDNKEWVLIDFFNVIVHIFQPEFREFYNIEGLWSDADIQRF